MTNIKRSESSVIIGEVELGENVILAQGTTLRSENNSVKIENDSMVLENSTLIGTKQFPVEVGRKTVFGHKCVVIGAKIGDLCEVGNSVTILEGSEIGDYCIFGEGTIIPKNTVVEEGSVMVGRPGRLLRKLNEKDKEMIKFMRGGNISLSKYKGSKINGDEGVFNMSKLHKYKDKYPTISESAKLLGSCEITGDVIVGENSIIASGVKIIGNSHGPVIIGDNVQILENTVLHLLPDNKLIIGDNVVIGPNSMIHGTIIGKNSIIESGSIICDFSVVGENVLVKSGTLIPQRKEVKDNEIVEGFPYKNIGENKELQKRPDWIIKLED